MKNKRWEMKMALQGRANRFTSHRIRVRGWFIISFLKLFDEHDRQVFWLRYLKFISPSRKFCFQWLLLKMGF